MQESKYKHGEDDEAGVLALAACVSHIFPMALDAAIQLDLFEIIARAGDGAQLSRSDIASQLPATNDGAAAVLDSLLRLLATHSLLTCSVSRLESGGIERRYGVAPAGKFFVGDENGVSFAQFGTFFLAGAKNLCFKDAILKGGNFSQRNNGKSYYDMTISNLTYSKKFNDAMRAHSTVLMRKVVKVYDGFASLDSIVDVGGGTGATLNIIITKYPSIRGINFDLPHVLHNLSAYNGIEHISGDMFVKYQREMPSYSRPQIDVHEKYASGMDMIMSTVLEGKERTEYEFEILATKVEFAKFKGYDVKIKTGSVRGHGIEVMGRPSFNTLWSGNNLKHKDLAQSYKHTWVAQTLPRADHSNHIAAAELPLALLHSYGGRRSAERDHHKL
ncbi:Caffeic acid 3-O-methyltransferase [Sesamum alatum]|uniref:Caffeic acid 3-O-methyltransferase n=1 Tax=Sesamum alatum TaxID=300844 RepID=A0AAE1YG67_9LAMI|nr:Caffeic acid 3-O-methyltransferase [Sesamum alatum]